MPGNHEYYTKKPIAMSQLLRAAEEVAAKHGVQILSNSFIDINNVRIIGSTLWSHIRDENVAEIESSLNDYQYIYGEDNELLTVSDTNALHVECRRYLRKSVFSQSSQCCNTLCASEGYPGERDVMFRRNLVVDVSSV